MRATIVSHGSMGDNVPMMALAVGLRNAGHEVVTVGESAGATLAERHDLEFHALEGRLRELMDPGGAVARVVDAGHLTWKALRMYDAHDEARLSLIRRVAAGSDAVVGLPAAHYHALAVARDIGARPILGMLQPLAPTSAMTPAGSGLPPLPSALRRPAGRLALKAGWVSARRPINTARRRQGLAPIADPSVGAFSLCAWSPSLVPRPGDWPLSRFAVTGHWALPSTAFAPDPRLAAFLDAGEAPVYVGLGSMQGFAGAPRLLGAVLTALATRRIILAAEPRALGDRELPNSVHLLSGFVPHEWLFPQCALIVHHCGAGTSHQAVASGVPSVPVPISMDQPFWADVLHRHEVASAPVNPRKPRLDRLVDAVGVADSAPVRRSAQQLAAAMAREDGVEVAVGCLEELVGAGERS